MTRNRIYLCVAVIAMGGLVAGQTPGKQDSQDATKAAKDGLANVAKSFKDNPEHKLGFTSAVDFTKAVLGDPVIVHQIKLDLLAKYTDAVDPKTLLDDQQVLLFPVLVDGNARASIRIQKVHEQWREVSFGRPALSQALAKQQLTITKLSPTPSSIVEVPSSNLVFLASENGFDLMLSSLFSSKLLDMAAGSTRKARDVFSQLAPIANNASQKAQQ